MPTVLTLLSHVLQPHRILYGFSILIQKQAPSVARKFFFKNEIRKTFSGNSITSERLGNTDLLSVQRYELKIDLDDLVDEFDIRHDNRKIKLH